MTRNSTAELQQFLDDLTPEQREAIASATPQDWAEAGAELVTDPEFWGEVAAAFLEGLTGRRRPATILSTATDPMNTATITMTLTPEQQTALYDALFSRCEELETNLPGSDRSSAMNDVAACLIEQMGYPVPLWMIG